MTRSCIAKADGTLNGQWRMSWSSQSHGLILLCFSQFTQHNSRELYFFKGLRSKMWLPTRWTSRHCDGLGLMFQQHYFSINSWCDKVNNITFQKTTLQFSGNGNTTRRSSNTGWTLKKGASWAKTPLRLRPMSNRSRVESLSSLESLTPSQEALTAMASHLLSPRRMVLSTCACCNCKSDWFFFLIWFAEGQQSDPVEQGNGNPADKDCQAGRHTLKVV